MGAFYTNFSTNALEFPIILLGLLMMEDALRNILFHNRNTRAGRPDDACYDIGYTTFWPKLFSE